MIINPQKFPKYSKSHYQILECCQMKLQQAYNEVMRDINSTTEYKGRGKKGQNKIGL